VSAAALPRRPTVGLRRRWLLAAAALLLVAVVAVSAWSFAWPSPTLPRELVLGQIDDFQSGTVTSYVVTPAGVRELSLAGDYGRRPQDYPLDGRSILHLARLPGGQLRAFIGEDRNFGWTVVWYPLADSYWDRNDVSPAGRFAEPRRGPFWDIEGHRIFGPAPGDLQPLEPRVLADGTVVVDVGPILEAGHQTETPLQY
jgi:hypothetical protein